MGSVIFLIHLRTRCKLWTHDDYTVVYLLQYEIWVHVPDCVSNEQTSAVFICNNSVVMMMMMMMITSEAQSTESSTTHPHTHTHTHTHTHSWLVSGWWWMEDEVSPEGDPDSLEKTCCSLSLSLSFPHCLSVSLVPLCCKSSDDLIHSLTEPQ